MKQQHRPDGCYDSSICHSYGRLPKIMCASKM